MTYRLYINYGIQCYTLITELKGRNMLLCLGLFLRRACARLAKARSQNVSHGITCLELVLICIRKLPILPVAILRLGTPSVRLVHTQESSHLATCTCANYLRRFPKGHVNSYRVIIMNGSHCRLFPRPAHGLHQLAGCSYLDTCLYIKPGPVGTPVSCIASPGGLNGHLNDVISGHLSEAYFILMHSLVLITKTHTVFGWQLSYIKQH